MYKVKLFFAAEGIAIDKQTNNITAFNVIEQLNFLNLPAVLQKLVVASLLEKGEEDPDKWPGKIKINLAGSNIIDQPFEHNFQGLFRTRTIMTLVGLPITEPGKMNICLCDKDDREIASYIIEVTLPKSAKIEQTEAPSSIKA